MNKTNKVNKPKINTSKSSDRRLAAGGQAAKYLLSNQKSDVKKLQHEVGKTDRSNNSVNNNGYNGTKTVQRQKGDTKWQDLTLMEWDPKHFRLFVGNLGDDATDELLYLAFSRYKTLSKAKVPMDKKSGKNKGYGFVAFVSADDYMKAFKEMNGKYVGHHPVMLKRAQTEIKPVKKANTRR